ncbi:MAG: glucose 1-dehydrogenase [Caldimonas sp.]
MTATHTAHRPLAGQKALVTGGASGIGEGVAVGLAAAGAAVAVNYFGDDDSAAVRVVEAIRADGGEAMAVQADVGKEDAVVAMFETVADAFGRIDILVANAGIQRDAAITDMTLDEWQAVIGTNLTGQFLCVREAIRRFLAQGVAPLSRARGKILCMSSVHELIPWAGHVNYAASKGGISQLVKSAAQEVAQHGIRVNGIAPGAIKTPINESAWSSPEALEKLLKLIPYGRIGEPDDIARAAVWLASDDADYVTGTTLFVDGGMTLYPAFRDNG